MLRVLQRSGRFVGLAAAVALSAGAFLPQIASAGEGSPREVPGDEVLGDSIPSELVDPFLGELVDPLPDFVEPGVDQVYEDWIAWTGFPIGEVVGEEVVGEEVVGKEVPGDVFPVDVLADGGEFVPDTDIPYRDGEIMPWFRGGIEGDGSEEIFYTLGNEAPAAAIPLPPAALLAVPAFLLARRCARRLQA